MRAVVQRVKSSKVVVGGEIVNEEGLFFSVIRESFIANLIDSCRLCPVQSGKMKGRAALVGAGDIAFSHIFA